MGTLIATLLLVVSAAVLVLFLFIVGRVFYGLIRAVLAAGKEPE